jgi:hypothetical protein
MFQGPREKKLPSPARTLQHSRRVFGFAASGAILHSILPGWAKALHTPRSGSPDDPLESSPIVRVTPDEIAYLMADRASRSPSLEVRTDETKGKVKRFWVQNWRQPEEVLEWKVNLRRGGSYDATLMISAPAGTRVQVEGPVDKAICETTAPLRGGYSWDRIRLSSLLQFPAGVSTIRIRLLDPVSANHVGAALKSIELLSSDERPRMDARLRAFKSDTRWLNQAKFGFMTQCGEWAYPPHGPRKPWPEMVERFDVEKFADMVDSTGAGYAVWSATWATYFFPAPIKAIDAIMPGRTSKRDLIGEIADALNKRNIRLILYYHLGHDINAANGNWWMKNWVSQDDKTLFLNNWCAIVSEVGERYGDRLSGWMFDDELVYYPAPYERLGKAAKTGNKSRLISYNPWIQARGTDFQDFQFGEGYTGDGTATLSSTGIWEKGPMQGLHAHGNFQIDGPDWGISKPDTQIEPPHFTLEKAMGIAMEAAVKNIALSWDMLMFDDGTVSDASLNLLQQVGQAVRKQYPKSKL